MTKIIKVLRQIYFCEFVKVKMGREENLSQIFFNSYLSSNGILLNNNKMFSGFLIIKMKFILRIREMKKKRQS